MLITILIPALMVLLLGVLFAAMPYPSHNTRFDIDSKPKEKRGSARHPTPEILSSPKKKA